MENMIKGLKVPKFVLINPLKILQMSQNLSARFFCPSTKVGPPQSVLQSMHCNAIVCVPRKSQSNKLNEAHVCIPHITYVPSFSYHLSYTSACSKTILSKKFGGLITCQFLALARQLFALKFVYSEKAIKFCQISTLLLSYVVPVKSKVEIFAKFCGLLRIYEL